MKSSSKVLVVTPILRNPDGRGQVFTRPLRSHLMLEAPGYLETFSLLGGDNFKDGSGTVTAKYSRAREIFLAGDFDYMLCLESDMIVPPDTIARLMACEADIAMGLYVFRHLGRRKWNAASVVQPRAWTPYPLDEDNARAIWGQVIDVVGLGQGCTLIKRQVLEALEFRNWSGVSCDWALACDAQAYGLTQRCDCGLVCGHLSLTPSPLILWPDIQAEQFVRIEFLD